jgi:hypothetical protein
MRPFQSMRPRSFAPCIGLVAVSMLAACSSPGTSATTTTVTPGTAVLGVRFSVWVLAHPATQVGGVSGYGNAVSRGDGSIPQYTDIEQRDGRVVSMRLNLPSGTHLAIAEGDVRANLPLDVRQTASWRGAFAGKPSTYCELVNYQSATLANELGVAAPKGISANIGTSLYEQTGTQHSSSIVTVNTAEISTTPSVLGLAC